MDLLEDNDWVQQPIHKPKIDAHLNSPVREDVYILFKEAVRLYPKREYDGAVGVCAISYVKLPAVISDVVDRLMRNVVELDIFREKMCFDHHKVVSTILQLSYTHGLPISKYVMDVEEKVGPVLFDIIKSYDKRLVGEFSEQHVGLTVDERGIYSAKITLEHIRDRMMHLSEEKNKNWFLVKTPMFEFKYALISKGFVIFPLFEDDIQLATGIVSREMMSIIVEKTTSLYFLSYDAYIMALDTFIGRFFTLYSARLLSTKFEFHVEPKDLINIYRIFDNGMISEKNEIYNQIKMFESIIMGMIIRKVDNTDMRHRYIDYLIRTAQYDGFKFMLEMYEYLKPFNEYQLSEIFGLYRHWGHPIVKEELGCDKVRKIATSRGPVNQHRLVRIKGNLIKQFCLEFIAKHNRWPRCEYGKLPADHKLVLACENNEKRLDFYQIGIMIEDWAELKIIGELEFDPYVDYTALLSDKAISPLRSENGYTYNQDITGINTRGKLSTQRRLLAEMMDRTHINLSEICLMIQERAIPPDWFIVKLSPKEREVNVKPRLFAMFVMEIRLYFAAIEHNIADKLFLYYPQQSMTMNEEKISKTLLNRSSPKEDKDHVEITIGIDFTSWNIHWSIFNTQIFTEMLDSWFGTPHLFTFGHQFFSMADVSLSSNFLVPSEYMTHKGGYEKIQSIYSWKHHNGGFEGIMQKLWTFITIGLLLEVERLTGIKSVIIGQGDNQVCTLVIPVDKQSGKTKLEILKINEAYITEKVDNFMRVLTVVTESIGLKLKLLESWISDSTLSFSKDILIRGGYASQLLKRIGRILPDVNDNYPTCSVKIGTLQTAGFSSSNKSYIMAIPWFLSNFETMMTIMKDISKLLKTKKLSSAYQSMILSEPFMTYIILSNGEFTGIPIIPLLEYEFRGHPDGFTTYLTYLTIISRSEVPLPRRIARKILNTLKNEKLEYGNASPELLISNPTAINFKTPVPISKQFKNEVYEYLGNNIKNKDVKELFGISNKEYDEKFYNYLISGTPVYPRLLNVIASHTPTGTRLFMISKFTDTKTMMTISLGGTRLGTTDMLNESDLKFYIHLINTYIIIGNMEEIETEICPTELSDLCRNRSYAKILGTRKIIGVTMPHPAHTLEIAYDDFSVNEEYVSIFAPDTFTFRDLLAVGKQPPFIGTTTREKVIGRVITVNRASRPFRDATRLKQMQNWAVDPESTLYQYINELISCRTNVPTEMVGLVGGTSYLGSHIHRVNDPVTKHNVRNQIRHSITTHFAFSSDKLGLTARGGDDYNIHISELPLYLMHQVVKETISDTSFVFTYMRAKRVNNCCHMAYDNMPVTTLEIPPQLPNFGDNPLIYASIDQFYETIVPESILIKRSNEVTPAKAIGFYMMSRYRGVHSDIIISSQNTDGPALSKISISEVKNNGILSIINEFAFYLFLYLHGNYMDVRNSILNMSSKSWAGVSEICLMEDVLPTVISQLRIDGIPDAYFNHHQVLRRLNELLVSKMDQIYTMKDLRSYYKTVKFFLVKNVKFQSIFLMWSYYNCCIKNFTPSLHKKLNKIAFQNVKLGFSWTDIMKKIMTEIETEIGLAGVAELSKTSPITIMENGPEAYFRISNPQGSSGYITFSSCQEYKSVSDANYKIIHDTDYPIPAVDFSEYQSSNVLTTEAYDNNTHPIDREPLRERKTRIDQAYRRIGTLSTAYLKYMQIIMKEGMCLSEESLCIADGEASVSYMISHISHRPVWYNSLQPRTVTTQRYEDFCPGSFAMHRSHIKGHMLSLIYGGDLTDPLFLKRLMQNTPDKFSLLTCDAETSAYFDPETKLKITISIMTLITHKRIDSCILKIFLNDMGANCAFISSLKLFYRVVRVVIPHYSSFENSECFIVCKQKLDNYPSHYDLNTTTLLYSSNYLVLAKPLLKMRQIRENIKIPFMYNNPVLLFTYDKLGKEIGLTSNYNESLKRLTLGTINTELKGPALIKRLAQEHKTQERLCMANVMMHRHMMGHKAQKLPLKSTLTHGEYHSLSTLLSRSTHIMRICELLPLVLQEPDLNKAWAIYTSHVKDTKILYNEVNEPLFDYTITNVFEWEIEHLKHIWRAWGHNNL